MEHTQKVVKKKRNEIMFANGVIISLPGNMRFKKRVEITGVIHRDEVPKINKGKKIMK